MTKIRAEINKIAIKNMAEKNRWKSGSLERSIARKTKKRKIENKKLPILVIKKAYHNKFYRH